MSLPAKQERKILTGIHASVWMHEKDEKALLSLEKIPGFEQSLKYFLSQTTEKSIYKAHLASTLRVSKEIYPQVDLIRKNIAKRLDCYYLPEVFVCHQPVLCYGAIGVHQAYIVISHEDIEKGTEHLEVLLAQEYGQILSGRVLYKTLLEVILKASHFLMNIPITGFAIAGVLAALKNWHEKSHLSADRAALLALQNPDQILNFLIQQTGASKNVSVEHIHIFLKQAQEYQALEGIKNSGFSLLNMMSEHQLNPVLRIQALLDWIQSGSYERILNGHYTRGQHKLFNTTFDTKRESKNSDKNPFSQFKSSTEDAAKKANDFLNQFFRR